MSSKILPLALIAAVTLSAMPSLAQEPPRPAPRPAAAELNLDFGGGRRVRIDCGETAIADCIAASQGLIDKVAAMPVVERGPKFGAMGFGPHGKHGHMKDKGPRGERSDAPPPAPPANEAPADEAPAN